ncbi:hypothetical protein KKE60_08510 [Patescibacteria group bacterium]|nr:hypothetical protein [Patescibacteria group bacterium]
MYGTSFLVPWESMTPTEIRAYKQRAIDRGVARMGPAPGLNIVTTPDDLTVRLIRAQADLAVTGSTVNEDQWAWTLAAGLNAGLVNVQLASNQLVVFYGVDDYDANPVATLMTFATAAAGGVTKMIVDLQDCRGFTYCAGMFSEPVVYDPQQRIYISVESDAVHAPEMIKLLGYMIEPSGTTLS